MYLNSRIVASTVSSASLIAVTAAGLAACAVERSQELEESESALVTCPITVDPFKELLIVHPSAVDDARSSNQLNGPWSFRRLISEMTPDGIDPADFVLTWLNEWKNVSTLNGFAVETRPGINVLIDAWPKRPDGTLDLARAPLKLLAIVNRVDLRSLEKPNGEGRFIFAFQNPSGGSRAFTIILEYNLPDTNGQTAAVWAERWHALGALPFGEELNQALESITSAFTTRGANPTGANGSALSQLRSNEIELNFPWELREFHLDATTGLLLQATTTNTPDKSLRGMTSTFTTWLTDPANRSSILAGTHKVPAQFLGGRSQSDGTAWTFPNIDEPLRKAFARATCNGCHSGEVDSVIDGFYHITPNTRPDPTGVSNVSAFLRNTELPRRAQDLETLLCAPVLPPPPPPVSLVLRARTVDAAASTSSVAPHLSLINTGDAPIDLSRLELRYWYTSDGAQPQSAAIDWAGRAPSGATVTSAVQASIQTTSRGGQSHFVRYRFTAAAGSLALHESIEVQSRFNKSDWSSYLQSNDHSFTASTGYIEWNRITVYLDGVLVWGVEP